MKTVFLLIGVRGAGKTTLLKNLKNDNDSSIYVMSSSTTRTPRDNDAFIIHENIDAWNNDDFVYHISIGNNKYGLRKSEIDKIQNSQIGITLYSPSSFSQIAEDQKKNPNIQFVTIGIDTIDTIEEQRNRVNNDDSRLDTPDNFAEYLEIIRNQCSITLKGKESALVDQVKTIANLFIHGGVVAGKDLEVLLKNNQLVNSAIIDNKKYECASYNFHVGDQYFFVEKNEDGLQDKRFELTETKGVTINPYTYIIIQTKEIMNLPTFIVGNFDLTVKLFHHGLILSTSTQIDPGYRGQAGMVLTQYSNMHADLSEKFYVPENVYIIGTMNDIDRSVDTFDFAMRRRFAFIPIMAKDSQDMITDDDLKCRMNNLNEAILSIDGLNENYQIGAAYFKQVQDGKLTIEELWDYYLDSLLRDYMQGMDDVNEQIEKLKGEYGYNKEKLEDSEPDVQTNSESDN